MSIFPKKHPVPNVEDIPAAPETSQTGTHPVLPTPAADWAQHQYPMLKTFDQLPPQESFDSHWLNATRPGHYVPYVGTEGHGQDVHIDPSKIPVNDIDLIMQRGKAYGKTLGDPHQVPIPVYIVDSPPLFGIERKVSTNQFTLVANTPVLLVQKQPLRNRLLITVSAVGPAFVGTGTESTALLSVGYACVLNVPVELHTNQALYVVSTVANTVVSVVEEFTIVEGQKRL